MSIYSKTQERISKVVNDINECQKAVESLDMKNEAKLLQDHAQTLKEGIFQVLFTGGFSAGKSTLLNALMQKELLKTSINAETAVVTKIVFGKEEKVIVYKKKIGVDGKPLTEEYTVEAFFKRYRVDQENPALFEDVDYVQLQQPQDGIGGTAVQLVDSPGTSNSVEDTKAARDFAERASAIVYLINATKPFEIEDKDYIKEKFANKELKNLFFVVNRIDCVAADEIDVLKQNVRKQLKDVFTYNGQFDERMFNERVFYTNAYGSVNARLEKTIKTQFGEEIKYTKDKDTYTGVPQFEDALGEFLTDDNRDTVALAAYVPKFAAVYVNADKHVKEQMKLYLDGEKKAEEDKIALEKAIKRIEDILDGITKTCENAAKDSLNRVKTAYDNYVTTIEVGWDSYFTDSRLSTIKFSSLDMIKLAMTKDKAKKDEKIKPIQGLVKEYIKSKEEFLNREIMDALTVSVSDLETRLANYEEQLKGIDCPINIGDIICSISNLSTEIKSGEASLNINVFQVILGIVGGDPESIVAGVAGKDSNKQAITGFIAKNLFEYIAINVVAWPIGLAMLGYRVWQMISGWKAGGNDGLKSLISGLKAPTVDAIRENKAKLTRDMESKLVGGIIRSGETFSESFKNELQSKMNGLDNAISNFKDKNFTLESEETRMNDVLSTLVEKISDISVLSGGRPLDANSIIAVANN